MESSKRTPIPNGQAGLPIAIAMVIAAVCSLVYWRGDGSIETVRSIIRLTARTSLCLFLLAFTATALEGLFPGRWTRWVSGNRRNFGIGFVLSHIIHLTAVAVFYRQAPALFWSVSPTLLIVLRGVGVAFIVLMSLSFFNARMLGDRRWRLITVAGSYYIWGAFLSGFGKRIPISPLYTIPVIALVLALLIKLTAIWKKYRSRSAPAYE